MYNVRLFGIFTMNPPYNEYILIKRGGGKEANLGQFRMLVDHF
jgi:hypothetical protein